MSHIFISYSHKDSDYAHKLAGYLISHGFDVWIDDRIDYGTAWPHVIQDRLDTCGALIVIMTPRSYESRWVQNELSRAQRKGKPIFPLLLEDDSWLSVEAIQYVDVRGAKLPPPAFYFGIAKYVPSRPLEDETEEYTPLSDDIDIDLTKEDANLSTDSQFQLSTSQPFSRKDLREEVELIPERIDEKIATSPTPTDPFPTVLPPSFLPEMRSEKSTRSQTTTAKPISVKPSQFPQKPSRNKSSLRIFVISIATIGLLGLLILALPLVKDIFVPPTEPPLPTLIVVNTVSPPEAGFPGGADIKFNNQWTPLIQSFNGVDMALVPKGCFKMGSEDGHGDEKPVAEQCFDKPFWIDRSEVTNMQYGSSGGFSGDDLPRENVNWYEAKAFCEGRSARLPTEAEWEYAARGPSNWIYPWGDRFVSFNVVYRENSNNHTAPVGSKSAVTSWVGALDMSGNVWEWVSTIYYGYPYPYNSNDGRENLDSQNVTRVMRGGSWGSPAEALRSSYRNRNVSIGKNAYFGFRCVRDY